MKDSDIIARINDRLDGEAKDIVLGQRIGDYMSADLVHDGEPFSIHGVFRNGAYIVTDIIAKRYETGE
tara:strand:- start:187 stop:390 length:204 start_codon:yes stop_codon:yes gene_type:complete